jgi:excisionase family DNA binding protein
MKEKKCLKTSEVAAEFGVSHDCITDWIRAGKLQAYRTPGGHYRITKEAVEELREQLLYVPSVGD